MSLLTTAFCGIFAPILSDEVFSLEVTAAGWGPMLSELRSDVHPPLYYCLLRGWLMLAPATEAGLRAFSGVCLIVAAALLWRFARRVGAPDFALSVVALWLANPLIILMAGYGRMYLLLVIWCILALDAAWRVCSAEPAGHPRLTLAIAATAGLLTHNWFIFFLCGLGAMMAWRHGRAVVRLAAPLTAGGVVYAVVWGGTALRQVAGRQEQLAWLQKPGWQAPLDVLVAHLWLALAAAPLILVLIAVRRVRATQPACLNGAALVGAVVSIALPMAISLWKPVFNPRFTIVAAPFAALALAGVVQRGGAAAAALLMVLGAGWGVWDASHPPACNSRDAARLLARMAGRGDTVIYTRLSRKPIEWYWDGGSARRFSFPAAIDAHPGYEGTASEAQLRAEARRVVSGIGGRAFVLADSARLESRILLDELRARGRERAPPCLACGEAGKHYFRELIVFDFKR